MTLPRTSATATILALLGLCACKHLKPNPIEPVFDGGPPPPSGQCEDPMPDEVTDGSEPTTTKTACEDEDYCDPWTPGYAPDPFVQWSVDRLLDTMSLTEKADQMRGTDPGGGINFIDIFRTLDNEDKGIRGLRFRDGPRGVNLAAQLSEGEDGYSSTFPVAMARGAAFDLDLEYRIGQAVGDETLASGNTMLLAPTVNVLRHPGWGRAQETYGEDPYALGRLGSAFVTGVQEFIPACVKHYAANNIENGRMSSNSEMDEQTLHEMYARHFGMIARDGGVACVMASYNLLNGIKATQNRHLLTEILRDEFGFLGFVMSDWWAMPPGTTLSATTDSLQANAVEAMAAGLDMELPWALNYAYLEAVTGAGKPVAEADVTAAARRILEQKYRFQVGRTDETPGLATPSTTLSDRGSIEDNEGHIALAHRAAVESMTLLKNENATLPIVRENVSTIAVLGAEVPYHVVLTNTPTGIIHFATDVRLGDLGSSRVFSDPAKSSGPLAGIEEAAGAGITVVTGSSAELADDADFVVVVAGLTPEDEGEEYTGAGDRPNFLLDGKADTPAQNDLIEAVAALGKPMVVVLEGGSVIEMPWLDDVPAVVMAWYPGMDGGRALGELLFGDVNFSGKLPITWPVSWDDLPELNEGTTTEMGYFLGYRYFDENDIEPLYPFGHGLSYTTYAYSHLQVPCSTVSKNGVVNVQVDVTNTGTLAGDEVAFLFVSYPSTDARRHEKELAGFHRVTLEPGETKRITFRLRVTDLSYWDEDLSRWVVESGPVEIRVGPSSVEFPLTDTMTVE